MGRGGYRPNSGPVKGTKYQPRTTKEGKTSKPRTQPPPTIPLNSSDKDQIRELLAVDLETREKAKRYSELLTQAGKGEKLKADEKREMAALRRGLEAKLNEGEEKPDTYDNPDAKDFLEKLLIAPDSKVDRKTKIQIANILLPFQHARKGEGTGKKVEQADRAAVAGKGKFAASAPPKLAVVTK